MLKDLFKRTSLTGFNEHQSIFGINLHYWFLFALLLLPSISNAGSVLKDKLHHSSDPLISGILVVSIALIGGVIAFVVVPYMWEQSSSTRSLWQSVCRLERENRRLRERKAKSGEQTEFETDSAPQQPSTTQLAQPFRYFEAISHRFRSAMNSIMGHSQLLLDSRMNADQESSAEVIYESSIRLMNLMNDVLDLSRIAAGKFEFNKKPFFVDDIFDAIGMNLGPQARDKNLEMMCYPDPNLQAKLNGDETRIRQILEVLIQDAIHFTDQGQITVHTKLLKASQDSQTIRFTINDTGSMLRDKDRRSRLLGTGIEQLHYSAQNDNSGLEVAIIHQLLRLMNSRLSVKERKNGGLSCSFELVFPVALHERRRLSTERHFTDQRILVAEDDPETLEFITSLLTSWGVDVDEAETLEGILDHLAESELVERPYSLLLIDSQLNNLPSALFNDGILATCAEHELHTILLSSRPDGTEAAVHDRVSILEKPFNTAQLNNAIYHVLSVADTREDSAAVAADNTESDINLRMLIVDDDRVSRELATRILRRAGYQTDMAEDGLRALAMIREHDYDLVLMDLDMPQMDGFESTKQIRKEHPAEELPIIALTANALDDYDDRCYQAGMNDYITKPFQIEKLLNTLHRFESTLKSKEVTEKAVK